MNYLVDTQLLLWSSVETAKLSKQALAILEDSTSHLKFSVASIWEIAIKRGLGRKDFLVEPQRIRRGLLRNGWNEIAISSEHAVATLNLPLLHKDPFDRLILAQAHVEGYTLLTSDKIVAKYPGAVRV